MTRPRVPRKSALSRWAEVPAKWRRIILMFLTSRSVNPCNGPTAGEWFGARDAAAAVLREAATKRGRK